MTNPITIMLREMYLRECLKEYREARETYNTRQEYLEARRQEIAYHKKSWQEEDND